MQPKIAHISLKYRPIIGGQEIYIKNLIEVLEKGGFKNTVYQPFWGERSSDNKTLPRIPFIGRVIKNQDLYVFNTLLCLHKKRELATYDALIVHYAFHTPPVWDLNKKTIIVSHGIEWSTNDKCIDDNIHEYIARKSFNRFVIVANDTHYFRHMGLNLKPGVDFFQQIAPQKWFIPNCVDTRVYSRDNGISEIKTKKIILVPRQINKHRGIDLAIRAFTIFSRRHPGYQLYIVGGPLVGSYYEYCARLAHELDIDKKVLFLGHIDNLQMRSYYSSATVTLIPTRSREGTSLSALESMACGTPTITTNIGGLKDLPSIQTDPEEEDIADKLEFTIKHLNQTSARQLAAVRNTFNIDNWRMAWLKVINSTIAQNGPAMNL